MNEKEIVEDVAAVGAMMPITIPDQVLQKVTPESVDEAFDAMRIKATDEDDDIDECDENSFEDSDNEEHMESANDKIMDLMKSVGIKPVYESVMESKSEFDIYFESEEDYVFEEAAKIDSDLRDIIKTLNEKGYETLYSCSGHPSARLKSDGKKDGIKYGKLYSTARIVFAEDYDLPNVPTGWVKKILKDDDKVKVSIYVKAPTFHIINGLPVDQFNKWKARYMYHLENWVKELPRVEDLKDTGSGEVATESADALEYADNLIMECMIDML